MDEPIEPTDQERVVSDAGKSRRRATKKPLVIRAAILMPASVLPWERALIAPALSSIEETADGQG